MRGHARPAFSSYGLAVAVHVLWKESLLRRARHGRRPPRPRLRLPTVQPPGTSREAFMRLVEEAVASIPEQFRERLANVEFVIEETLGATRCQAASCCSACTRACP